MMRNSYNILNIEATDRDKNITIDDAEVFDKYVILGNCEDTSRGAEGKYLVVMVL